MKRLVVLGLSTAALAGCASPQYPIVEGYVPPPRIAPKYPASQLTPAAYSPAAQTESAPAGYRIAQTDSAPASAAPSPARVDSAPLEAITTAPSASPPPASTPSATPAASPPAATPPAQTPTQAPAPPAATPRPAPQAYTPPPAPERRTEVRYVADGKVVAARGMYRDYQVQKGDHLDAIARDLKTTRSELVEANHLRKPYGVRPGQHLKVPVAKAYVVGSGDTMAAVAKRFGVSLGELSALNDLPERGRLTPGMYVALPAQFDDHGPTRITVTEQVYAAAPRPRATYNPAPAAAYSPAPTATYSPGPRPYVPSKYALAAAAAAAAQGAKSPIPTPTYAYNAPTTSSGQSYTPSYSTNRPAEAPVDTTALASLGQGKFIWPVRGDVLSKFGSTGVGRRNDGVDIAAAAGTEVRATSVGEVVYAGDQVPGFGNLVLIKHGGGWVSAYAHLASVDVHMRDTVYQGQQIGVVGSTGGVSQPQLHFEIRYASSPADKAKPIDPLLVLPK
jgi:murein DD-endopeptidase MepM/ murein hydrolase activator NlpD